MCSTSPHSKGEETTAGYNTRTDSRAVPGRARAEEVAGRRGRQPQAALVRWGAAGPPQHSSAQD